MGVNVELAILNVLLFWMLVAPHEFAHAWAAVRLGDPTPRLQGRLTLNPLAHADFFGTIILPLVSSLLGGGFIGWGKPVLVQPQFLRGGRFGFVAVALAGPGVNLLIAGGLTFVAIAFLAETPLALEFVVVAAQFSAYLGFFNLLPVPPLDGSRLLLLLPGGMRLYEEMVRYGFLILILMLSLTPLGGWLIHSSWLTVRWWQQLWHLIF